MPHPFYNFFVGLAGSGLAQGGPGAKESALAPELGHWRAEPGHGITTHVPDKMDGIRNVDHADLSVLEIPQMRRRYNLPAYDGCMYSKKRTKKFPKGNLVPVPTRESIV